MDDFDLDAKLDEAISQSKQEQQQRRDEAKERQRQTEERYEHAVQTLQTVVGPTVEKFVKSINGRKEGWYAQTTGLQREKNGPTIAVEIYERKRPIFLAKLIINVTGEHLTFQWEGRRRDGHQWREGAEPFARLTPERVGTFLINTFRSVGMAQE